jgi:hypothetical protein
MKLVVFFENLSIKFNFHYNLKIIMGTSHEDHCTILIIVSSVLLMRMFWTKFVEKQNTYFMFNNFFLNVTCYNQMIAIVDVLTSFIFIFTNDNR